MDVYQLKPLLADADRTRVRYQEFIRKDSLSVGVYTLPARASDPQQPHTADEVYYVVSGLGTISVAGEQQTVEAGSVVFVAAGVEHHFHSISDDLSVLVFFAPAE